MAIYVISLLSFGIYRARNFVKSIYSFKDEKNKEIQKMLNIQNELSKFLGIDKQLLKLNNEYDMSKNK